MCTWIACVGGGADDQRRRTRSTTSIGTSSSPRDLSRARRESREGAKRLASNSSARVGQLLRATTDSSLVTNDVALDIEALNGRSANRSSSGGSELSRGRALATCAAEEELVESALFCSIRRTWSHSIQTSTSTIRYSEYCTLYSTYS